MIARVKAFARLHLGLYNTVGDTKLFGGVGVYVEPPTIEVEAQCLGDRAGLVVENESRVYLDDVVEIVDEYAKSVGIGARVRVLRAYPRHVGLGSTTQLALSIAIAALRACGKGVDVYELAQRLGRGSVSGVGVGLFAHGGLVVDAGKLRGYSGVPKLLARLEVPEDWRFIVLIPRSRRGLDEKSEASVIASLEPLDRGLARELAYIVLNELLPAVVYGDLELFGRSLAKYQTLIGTYFSKYQGGVWCCRESAECIEALKEAGAKGWGQSSWGPTVYGIARASEAEEVLRRALDILAKRGVDVDAFISRPVNRGALVEVY